jgi:Polyketide cyclase / dehydrase and lipid transport
MKAIFTALLACCALGAVGGAAQAASLTSGKKLEVKVDPAKVDAEKKALWDRFGGWCAIADWHPAVKSCEEIKDGDDVYRKLTLQDGGIIKEKLLNKAAESYRYAIVESPLPVKNYEAQFSIVPDDDDEDEVNIVWAATYDAADGKDDKDARKTIDGIFKDGIDNIKKMIGDKGKDKD